MGQVYRRQTSSDVATSLDGDNSSPPGGEQTDQVALIRKPSELRSYTIDELRAVCADYEVDTSGADKSRLLGRLLPRFPWSVLTAAEFSAFSDSELSMFCAERSLPTVGTKDEMVDRLVQSFLPTSSASSSPTSTSPTSSPNKTITTTSPTISFPDDEPSTAIPKFKLDNADEPASVIVNLPPVIPDEVEPSTSAPTSGGDGDGDAEMRSPAKEPVVVTLSEQVETTTILPSADQETASMDSEDSVGDMEDSQSEEPSSQSTPSKKQPRKRKSYIAARGKVFSRRVASPGKRVGRPRKTASTTELSPEAAADTPSKKRTREEGDVEEGSPKKRKLSPDVFFKTTLPVIINGITHDATPITEKGQFAYLGKSTQPIVVDGKSMKLNWELTAWVVDESDK